MYRRVYFDVMVILALFGIHYIVPASENEFRESLILGISNNSVWSQVCGVELVAAKSQEAPENDPARMPREASLNEACA